MRKLKRFFHDRSGVAAVEFAWVLPVMMLLLLGGLQVTNALQASRKVTEAAASVADLVAQVQSVNNADVASIFSAADGLMAPFNTANLGVVMTSVTFAGGVPVVAWSDGHGTGQPRQVGASVSGIVPATIIGAGTSVIMTEVQFHYVDPLSSLFNTGTSFFTKGTNFSGGFDFSSRFFARPRRSVAVGRTP